MNNESPLSLRGPVITFDGLQQIVFVGEACDAKLCHTSLLEGRSFHKSVSHLLIFFSGSLTSLTPQNENSRNIVNVFFPGKLQVKRKWSSGIGDNFTARN